MPEWGVWGSSDHHVRYAQRMEPPSLKRCHHGIGFKCPNRQTHMGMANGVALTSGCEFHVYRWVRLGHWRSSKSPEVAS